ncbi:hypothetical protein Pint_33598 [Pistacia integerrima]|uniref:Uncharacterized protein n=1 Tax=Pistacia integerrima TaxID=434235 RepID=A0ACC0X4J0_9ROSI|nr:hypothetical protein Pint_33598 [Pistacia integerrima]
MPTALHEIPPDVTLKLSREETEPFLSYFHFQYDHKQVWTPKQHIELQPKWDRGCTKPMLIANTIFRMEGAAILLSNRHKDKHIAKYKLQHLIRTHMGSQDQLYLLSSNNKMKTGK